MLWDTYCPVIAAPSQQLIHLLTEHPTSRSLFVDARLAKQPRVGFSSSSNSSFIDANVTHPARSPVQTLVRSLGRQKIQDGGRPHVHRRTLRSFFPRTGKFFLIYFSCRESGGASDPSKGTRVRKCKWSAASFILCRLSTNANFSTSVNDAAFCYCLFHCQPELVRASRSWKLSTTK